MMDMDVPPTSSQKEIVSVGDFGTAHSSSCSPSPDRPGEEGDGASAHVAIEIDTYNDNDEEANDARPSAKKTFRDTDAISLRTVQFVELSLEHITYMPVTRTASAKGSKKRTTVLSDVTTVIAPFQLSAWMGPSGCGKTSFLSVAAGLVSDPANDLAGDSRIKINGEAGALPKRLVGVVWQDDLLLSNLTVKETVRFAARLKNPKDVTDEEVAMLVDNTLSKLGLTNVQDSMIGVPGGIGKSRGISGGERKRVAVAVELVASPSILLLDEPTSGLDATSAYQLMVTLKKLAALGHSIAVVIHQPRTSIFNMFDNLLLLSQGKMVYEGEPMKAREFLESCPGVSDLPPETGKADWIMDVINEDENREGGGILPKLWKEYSRTQQQPQPQSTLEGSTLRNRHSATASSPPNRRDMQRLSTMRELVQNEPKFQSSFWRQLKLLTIRAARQQRGQRLTQTAMILTFSYTAFTALAWGRIPDTTTYIDNRASLLFFIIIAQANSVVTTSVLIFSNERRLLARERAKKMYGVSPYFIAMTLSDMINSVALPTLYGCIVYWICNFRATASAFFAFALTLYLTISAAQSTGLFFSVLIPNTAVALRLAPFLTLCLMILGGFYIPLDLINPWIAWFSWLSMARYGFSAFIINEFGGRSVVCDGSDDDVAYGCPRLGSDVIASYGIEGVWTSIWPNVAMLIVIQVVLRLVTYVLLRRSK